MLSKLAWPRAYRIHELAEVLDQESLVALIVHFANKGPKERAFLFPRRQVIRKVLSHYYGQKVQDGELSWDEVMEILKGQFESLKQIGISRKEIKRLFKQRNFEIEREIKIEKQ